MKPAVYSLAPKGYDGVVVEIECRITRGLPSFLIVGFASRAVGEAKERIRGAFAASGLKLPVQRIIINLAPGDIPKEGTGFDVAIAASILLASLPLSRLAPRSMLFGELGLDGVLRPVRGLIGALLSGRNQGYTTFYIPASQYQQVALIPEITLIPIHSLQDLYRELKQPGTVPPRPTGTGVTPDPIRSRGEIDFSQVAGQARAKRALEIAAAGGHNILLSGPPGVGKSLLAKALPSILPPLNHEETLEVTHLHSLASQHYDQLIQTRPFRAPHHSTSRGSILGGGQRASPGEISLAHHGVLMLDELPEFDRATLEALRQPLEDKSIRVIHAGDNLMYPADFILVATANPCSCGYYGSRKSCRCPPASMHKYQQKLSGPVLDRIDLYIEVEEVEHRQLLDSPGTESSATIQSRVAKARERRTQRPKLKLSQQAKELLNTAAARLQLSARGYMRTLKVATTIAHLDDSTSVQVRHISEALQYRQRENP